MATPTNVLQQVQTYQRSSLLLLKNSSPFIKDIANTKFKNFQNIQANLGSVVDFDLPPRFTTSAGLVVTWQSATQRVLQLSCDQASNTSFAFTAQERIFNVEKDVDSYMEVFGVSAVAEMASYIEANVALNFISACPVMTVVEGQNVPTGALHTESGPYRFFGDGISAINSFTQLAQFVQNFKAFGAPDNGNLKIVLPNTIIPQIVGSGLNQFVPRRNDDMAMSWDLGSFGGADYFASNLLPVYNAGNVGNASAGGNILTVVSTNDPTGANITQITFSGAGTSDDDAIYSGDLLQATNASGVKFRTFIGHKPTRLPLQIRATANAGSTGGGQVTISFFPALQATPGANQNITANIVAGMTFQVAPSHAVGAIIGGKSLFLSMPQLPDQRPYDTANEYDKDLGISLRMTYGSVLGQNQSGMIYDGTWGSVQVPEYSGRILIPLNQ